MKMFDRLVNLVANLGTERDKGAHNFYTVPTLTNEQLAAMYRSSWLARKIVDIPAEDATASWRNWQSDNATIERLEGEEKRLGLQAKVHAALQLARLQGGAGIYIHTTAGGAPDQALRPGAVKLGGIQYLAVLPRRTLSAGDYETDPMQPGYGFPKFWRIGGSSVAVHPSRIVLFIGNQVPDAQGMGLGDGFGDSVLLAALQAIDQSDGTMANVASLVFESKVDVFGIPDFMENVGDEKYRAKLMERIHLAARAKGVNGMLLRDTTETYESKSASFSGLPDVMDRFLQQVCGAADIPATRLLGQSAKGLGNSGDGDLRNYYDRIASMQKLQISPTLALLDECVIRSATGARDGAIHYEWPSLWKTTPEQRATVGKTIAETAKILSDTKMLPEDVLATSTSAALVEAGVFPGLDADEAAASGGVMRVGDAAPAPLYVSRKVCNALEILEWAREQGLTGLIDPLDMHVTVCYSRTPVDWMAAGTTWGQDDEGEMKVAPGGARMVAKFGNALVLLFNSSDLTYRHMQLREIGASWDHGDYQPHITLRYDAENIDPATIKPYTDEIELGPEIFEKLRLENENL